MRLQFFYGNEEVATDIMSKRSSTSNSLLYFGNPPQYCPYTLLALADVLCSYSPWTVLSLQSTSRVDTGYRQGARGWGAGAEQLLELRHHPAPEEGDGHLLALVTWARLHHCTNLGQGPEQPRVAALQPRPSDLEIYSLCNTASTQSLL